MEVYFIVTQPIGKTKKFKLSEGEYVIIGRSKEHCQVPISDEMCSSKHCKVTLTNNCIFVEDTASKNGIYLNGQRILKQRFYLDDKLKIGDSVMYIHQDKLSEEDKSYLTFNGNGTRIHGGYTLELDDEEITQKTYTHKKLIQRKYERAKRKKVIKKSEDRKKAFQQNRSQSLEMLALGIDLIITSILFFIGLVSYKFIHTEEYNKLVAEKLSDSQIFLHQDVSTWTFSCFILAIAIFALTRGSKEGSFGEKILKIT